MSTNSDHPKGYTADTVAGERQFPRGPLGYVESPCPVAIGFCRLCGTNSRRTTAARGVFNCPTCFNQWYDDRVGEQTYSLEDFVTDERE